MKNIHILPTDKPSRLTLLNKEKLLFSKEDCELSKTKRCVNQHIYITSDEEIKEGDWCLDEDGLKKCTAHAGAMNHYFQKIILTTDQDLIKDSVQAIPDEFLEWFVNNPSCEEVEMKLLDAEEKLWEEYYKKNSIYPKYLWYYRIIIPKEEPKQRLEKYSERFDNKDNEVVEGIFDSSNWGKRMVDDVPKQ